VPQRLSGFLLGHKLAVLGAWLLVLVAGMAAAGTVSTRLSQEFAFPGEEGYEANAAILRTYGTGGPGSPLVPVVTLPEGVTVDSPGVRSALAAAFGGIAEDPRLRVLAWPATTEDRRLVADGGRTVFALVWQPWRGVDAGASELTPVIAERLRAALPAGSSVQVTGIEELAAGAESQPGDTGVLVETLVGGVGALVVLAFVFGSLLALVPLLVAAVAILAAFLAVYGLTAVTDVSFLVQYLVALIGLGVAIDYSLLLVTRWREELAAGHDREQAVHRAMATAGRAVVTSAGTVAVGLLVLVLLPVPFLRSVGYGGLLIPLAAAAVTLTLLPVLLATVGPRLDWPARRRAARGGGTGSRLWTRWAGGVVRHRWLATLAALAVLLPLGAAALGLRLGEPPADTLARSGPAREGLTRLERAGVGSGVLTPIEVLLPLEGSGEPQGGAPVDRRTDPEQAAGRLAGVPGVQAAVAPAGPAWRRDGTALVAVLPAAETGGRDRRGDRRAGPRPGRRRAARRPGRRRRRARHRRDQRHLRRLPADAGGRGAGYLRAADQGVPVAAAGAEGDRAESPVDRRRLWRAGAGVAGGVRLAGRLGHPRHRRDRHVGAADDLRVPLRPVHGLRGLPAVPHARGVRRHRVDRHGGGAGARPRRPAGHQRRADSR
jgi:putative drug exporter of the RND superfamily